MIAAPSMPKTTPLATVSNTPLTGEDLIRAISTEPLKSLSLSEAAAACGYVSAKGQTRIAAFCKSVLQARGLFVNERRTRTPSYRTKVGPNGNAVVGAAYLRQLRANPGDPLNITVSRNRIILTVASNSGSETTADEV